jgi:hypothetical protein
MVVHICEKILFFSLGTLYSNVYGDQYCHNLSLGLTTKVRACKCAGQEGSPWVTSHAPESVRECEGMNPHTPK